MNAEKAWEIEQQVTKTFNLAVAIAGFDRANNAFNDYGLNDGRTWPDKATDARAAVVELIEQERNLG